MGIEANQAAAWREQDKSFQSECDQALVERAQSGDVEAFGELIGQHRNKARRWAERMTGDPHLADDVVQDALIRAFLHLGSLADTSRFLPWLHRIVQNQANMRLRRGGPFKREQPFTSWQGAASTGRVEWDSLDSILDHLTCMASNEAIKQSDPVERLLRKELFETIHALLHCLNRKERGIFEAYFFQQLSPDEIAAMYQTTTGTVYTYLHRSRRKLRQTHLRATLGLHDSKGGGWMAKQKVLQLPEWQTHRSVQMSFVDRIGHMLAALGDNLPVSELMGVSRFAFRMKISNKTTFSDGIYVFDWRRVFRELMDQLGYEASMVCGQLSQGPVPLLAAVERFPVVLPIEEAVSPFIRKYIDLSKPLLYFDTLADRPYVHEWALIYGYDDERRMVHMTDARRENGKTVSYEEIAENPLRFLAGIDGKKENRSVESAKSAQSAGAERDKQAIQFAVNYARNGCDYVPMTTYLTYTSGLATYDRWIGFLQNSYVTPNRYGMGQLAAVYADAKRHAAQYLRGVRLQGEAMRLILLAAEAYEQAAEALDMVSGEVPFVRSSEPLTSDALDLCCEQLEKAKEFETAAIGYMEKAIKRWGGEGEPDETASIYNGNRL